MTDEKKKKLLEGVRAESEKYGFPTITKNKKKRTNKDQDS
ncbi:hypothetical protein ABH968_005206 [Lysinibacillus sp. RC79]